MRGQAFTNEEVKILEENKYTSFVSNSSIRFTLEFKGIPREASAPCSLHEGLQRQVFRNFIKTMVIISKYIVKYNREDDFFL